MFQWKVLVWSRGIRASRGWMEAFSISFSCLWPNQTQTEQSTECAGRWEAANQLLLTHCTDARSCSQKASLNQLEISSCQKWNCLTRNLTYEKQQEWEKVTQCENAIVLFPFRRVSDMIMLDCLSVHHVGPDWNIFILTIGSITISAQTMNDFDLKNLNAPSSN